MRACITGASTGLGRDMARALARRGWELVLVARRKELLHALATELPVPTQVIVLDLSTADACHRLHDMLADTPIDMLVNNAGFGACGTFLDTPLHRELEMIDLNVQAVHILSKLFLADFQKRGRGYLLNVASVAGFLPGGPLLSTYYATKSYVLSLSHAIHKELSAKNSHVSISVLCPGPIATEFDRVANVTCSLRGADSAEVAEYAISHTLRRKFMLLPNLSAKALRVAWRLLPDPIMLSLIHRSQKKKLTGNRHADTERADKL